jgi:hypothetical protein
VAVVEVVPGICGFRARIVSEAGELCNVTLEITSDCQHIRQLAERLTQVSALEELGSAITDTATYRAAASCKAHPACPVPAGILKAIEVAAGMALPADVHISIGKD